MPKKSSPRAAQPESLADQCAFLLCQAVTRQGGRPFYVDVFEHRFTPGELRRRLRLPAQGAPDPRPTLCKVAARLAKRCCTARITFKAAPDSADFTVRFALAPTKTWDEVIDEVCGCTPVPFARHPPLPEEVHWQFPDPIFPDDFRRRQRLRTHLLEHLMRHAPAAGKDCHVLFIVHTRAGLARALPRLTFPDRSTGVRLETLMQSLRLPDSLGVFCSCADRQTDWQLGITPFPDWPAARAQILADLRRTPTELTLDLSHNAARLYDWIVGLKPSEMLDDWTPLVEPVIATEIGFSPHVVTGEIEPLPELVAEINAHTGYALTLQCWSQGPPWPTRIRVARAPLTLLEGTRELERHIGQLRRGERAVLTLVIQPAPGAPPAP